MIVDVHNHIIFGVDDGASKKEDSLELIDIAYSNGTRLMCCTPHVYPEYFGDNAEAIIENYKALRAAAAESCPEMKLCLGSEIHYTTSCLNWIRDKKGFTMNGTSNVLIEFAENDSTETIVKAVSKLLNSGVRPIIAHPERYPKFVTSYKEMESMKRDDVLLQCDAGAFIGEYGFNEKRKSRQLLKRGLVDLIASDAHSVTGRNTDLSRCEAFVSENFGERYCRHLFYSCPLEILGFKDRRD